MMGSLACYTYHKKLHTTSCSRDPLWESDKTQRSYKQNVAGKLCHGSDPFKISYEAWAPTICNIPASKIVLQRIPTLKNHTKMVF